MTVRISLLIRSPLSTLMHAMGTLDGDVRRQIGSATKSAAEPIWREELQGRAESRIQSRLAESGRVGVTQQNVFLRAGAVGRLSSGTAISDIAKPAEFGANPDRSINTRSRKGTTYRRRLGTAFGAPRRGGHIAHPAARDAIPRFASLWVQTARRTIHELIEKA